MDTTTTTSMIHNNDNTNHIDRSTAPLLFLLDGLLSHDEQRIHDSLIQLRNYVQHIAPDLLPSVLPPIQQQQRDEYIRNNTTTTTTTKTVFSSSSMVPPRITWKIFLSSSSSHDHHNDEEEESSTRHDYRYVLDLCHIIHVALNICPQLAHARASHDGSTVLHFASSLGNVPIAHLILQHFPESATIPNNKGKIPLHYAAREGRIDMVKFFLHNVPHTASIATDKRKLALHFAAGDGHGNVCYELLKVYPRGASLPSSKGKLPLHLCARWGHIDIAHQLIQIYPDSARALDWEGSLPLHDAAREGQVDMSRYLLEKFPMALSTANLRNEIPLFPAVRSCSLDLVALLVQAWPGGSRCILQNISANDHLYSGWMSWDILELLLRGSVQKLNGCTLLDDKIPPKVKLITNDNNNWRTIVQPPMPPCWALQKTKKSKADKKKNDNTNKKVQVCETKDDDVDERYHTRLLETQQQETTTSAATIAAAEADTAEIDDVDEIAMSTIMRSKSPVLQECIPLPRSSANKKRSFYCFKTTESQNECHYTSDESTVCFYVPEEERKFIPLHSAFECSASCHVIRYVLDNRINDNDIYETDERGMLPLHWAVAQCNRPQLDTCEEREHMINIILDKLIATATTRTSDDDDCKNDTIYSTAMIRDKVYNRLPLHFALLYQADFRVIQALIHAYPSSAVDKCLTRDNFNNKTPLHIAIQCDCELDIIYLLLKSDPAFVSREFKRT